MSIRWHLGRLEGGKEVNYVYGTQAEKHDVQMS